MGLLEQVGLLERVGSWICSGWVPGAVAGGLLIWRVGSSIQPTRRYYKKRGMAELIREVSFYTADKLRLERRERCERRRT